MPTPSPDQLAVLRAALDRLIPRDEFPSATEAGVDDYIVRQLRGDLIAAAPLFWMRFDDLEAKARRLFDRSFVGLSAPQQDSLLAAWEREEEGAPFFQGLLNLAAEGYYADPGNGGNRDGVSWKMLGYDPRQPPRVSAP